MSNVYIPREEDGWLEVESRTPEGVVEGSIVDVIFRDGSVLVGAIFGMLPARGYGLATFEWNDSPTDVLYYRMYTEMSELILEYDNVLKFKPLNTLMEEHNAIRDRSFQESEENTEDRKEILITRFLEMIESVDINDVETIDISTSVRYYNGISESHYISLEGGYNDSTDGDY